jgi:antitoxin component of RelBE/YafQ-DinJ toxin-antitoxin module
MRTTIEFDADTAAAVEAIRREMGLGVSEAVNTLIRRGLLPRAKSTPFVQQTQALGIKVDVSNVAEALENLEGSQAR